MLFCYYKGMYNHILQYISSGKQFILGTNKPVYILILFAPSPVSPSLILSSNEKLCSDF